MKTKPTASITLFALASACFGQEKKAASNKPIGASSALTQIRAACSMGNVAGTAADFCLKNADKIA
jgi:hypothetical protein